jgi:hypothetical protein
MWASKTSRKRRQLASITGPVIAFDPTTPMREIWRAAKAAAACRSARPATPK